MDTQLLTPSNPESFEQTTNLYPDVLPRSERVAKLAGIALQETANTHQHSEFVQEFIDQQRHQYKQDIEHGISEDWLHEGASGAIGAVDGVRVIIGKQTDDYFGKNEGGLYLRDINTVFLRRSGMGKAASFKGVAVGLAHGIRHEFNHAVLGRLPIFNEAVTEHIALVMKFGRPDIIYPYSRPGFRGGYVDERRLLHAVLNDGLKQVPAQLATKAYSDPAGVRGDAFKEFSKQVDEAWGEKHTLFRLSNLIRLYEDKFSQKPGLTELEVQKLAIQQVLAELRTSQKREAKQLVDK